MCVCVCVCVYVCVCVCVCVCVYVYVCACVSRPCIHQWGACVFSLLCLLLPLCHLQLSVFSLRDQPIKWGKEMGCLRLPW